jgi:hypothetical protein
MEEYLKAFPNSTDKKTALEHIDHWKKGLKSEEHFQKLP